MYFFLMVKSIAVSAHRTNNQLQGTAFTAQSVGDSGTIINSWIYALSRPGTTLVIPVISVCVFDYPIITFPIKIPC